MRIPDATMIGIFGPMSGFALAPALAVSYGGVAAPSLALFAGLYLLTALGVEVGYHRLFTHRSFTTGPVARLVLGILGSMAGEGSLGFWVGTHRKHHRHADGDGDPHSPLPGGAAAIWRAHVGWMLQDGDVPALPADLRQDAVSRFVDRTYLLWFLLGLVFPAALCALSGGWRGACEGFVWGGLLRVAVCHQFTCA